MAEQKEFLTKEKFEELQVELETLKTVKRKEVAENLEYAKSLGDLSENAEYQEAREMQANVEDRIQKLENMMKTSVVISENRTDKIGIGSKITIKNESSGESFDYILVGTEEANLSQKKISVQSPVGQAVAGKVKGDSVTVVTPKGTVKFKVVSIG
jgi:transcription elongation factor GreA